MPSLSVIPTHYVMAIDPCGTKEEALYNNKKRLFGL